jgi:hypothetical protein
MQLLQTPESYCLLLLVFGQAVMQRDAVTAYLGKSVIPNLIPKSLSLSVLAILTIELSSIDTVEILAIMA